MLHFETATTPFDLDYVPALHSRQTTNFVNLARNETNRRENLEILFAEIGHRYDQLNRLNPCADGESTLHLDIVTVLAHFEECASPPFPIAEFLTATFENKQTGDRTPGPTGFNFSSYIRDYDFNSLLPRLLSGDSNGSMKTFGQLHGLLYRMMFRDFWAGGVIDTPCIFAISVSSRNTYQAQAESHRILGRRYRVLGPLSLTDRYFAWMGLEVSYFQPPGAQAPLAFYHRPGDLLERPVPHLAALIAVMETFQRIYRPEIYQSRNPPGEIFTPSLTNDNFVPPPIHYDRVERDQKLGPSQANLAWNEFLQPHAGRLAQLLKAFPLSCPPDIPGESC